MYWLVFAGVFVAVIFVLFQLFTYFVAAPDQAYQTLLKSKKDKKDTKPLAANKKASTSHQAPTKAPKQSKPAQHKSEERPIITGETRSDSPANFDKKPKADKPHKAEKKEKAEKVHKEEKAHKEEKPHKEEKAHKETKPEKKEKGAKLPPKKVSQKAATEVDDATLARQWGVDFAPSTAAAASATDRAAQLEEKKSWKHAGAVQMTSVDYKQKMVALQAEHATERENTKNIIDKYREELAHEKKLKQAVESRLNTRITKLEQDLASVKEGGLTSNDSLVKLNYTHTIKEREEQQKREREEREREEQEGKGVAEDESTDVSAAHSQENAQELEELRNQVQDLSQKLKDAEDQLQQSRNQ